MAVPSHEDSHSLAGITGEVSTDFCPPLLRSASTVEIHLLLDRCSSSTQPEKDNFKSCCYDLAFKPGEYHTSGIYLRHPLRSSRSPHAPGALRHAPCCQIGNAASSGSCACLVAHRRGTRHWRSVSAPRRAWRSVGVTGWLAARTGSCMAQCQRERVASCAHRFMHGAVSA